MDTAPQGHGSCLQRLVGIRAAQQCRQFPQQVSQRQQVEPLFPSDQQILLDRGADTFIERYVRIPPELRSHDLYLYEPTSDYYWPSEYFYQGQPAKFRCSFFIHFEPAADHSTKVEIFEYQPTIWAGEYLGLSAYAILPTTLHDTRPVQSTTADRNELLQIIQQAVH